MILNPVLEIGLISLIGFLFVSVMRVPVNFKFTIVAILAFANAGSFPLILLKGAC